MKSSFLGTGWFRLVMTSSGCAVESDKLDAEPLPESED